MYQAAGLAWLEHQAVIAEQFVAAASTTRRWPASANCSLPSGVARQCWRSIGRWRFVSRRPRLRAGQWWAERGIAVYGDDAARPEAIEDLRKHAETCPGDPAAVPAPDLVERTFTPPALDRLWVADITQQRTDQGWLYLAVVLDAFSRRIVGWSMATHLRTMVGRCVKAQVMPPGLAAPDA